MQIGRDHVSGPAVAAAKAFSVVAGLLAEVRAAVADLCTRLHDLDLVLVGQSGNARLLDAVEAAAKTVQHAVSDGSSRAAPERIGNAVTMALSCLDEIGSCTRELDAVAGLTNVTARSLGLTSFDDYVISLRRLVQVLRTDSTQLSEAVTVLQSRRVKAVHLFARANSDLEQVSAMLANVAKERAETEKLLLHLLDEVAALALRLPAATASEIEVLMTAMQFADALSQRLDHIGMVLAFADAPSSDTGPLARALIEALVGETREIADAVTGSLARISQLARDAGHILGGDGEGPAGRALHLGRQVLGAISEHTRSVLDAIEGAGSESNALCHSAEDAALRFASVMEATDAMHIYAINASLLARRDAAQQGAMNVLSIEVQRKAAQCARLATACHGAIEHLSLPADLVAFGAVTPVARAFRDSVGATAAAVEDAEVAAARLQTVRLATVSSLDRLADATGIAGKAVLAIYAAAEGLADVAQSLPRDVRPDADTLLQLMDIYSMEVERRVHRQVFGLPEAAKAAAAVGFEEDLLAAIMF